MHLSQEKYVLFFFSFLVIFLQTVSAQDTYSRRNWINELNLPAPAIKKNANSLPSFAPSIDFDEAGDNFVSSEEKTEFSEAGFKSSIKDAIKYNFRTIRVNERNFDFVNKQNDEPEKRAFQKKFSSGDSISEIDDKDPIKADGFKWRAAFTQSLMFLGVQHGYAILGQLKTRKALKGKFFEDYVDSVKSLHGWDDGGRFFTNYIAHPLQGSLTGFIYIQNSPQATREQFGSSGAYWKTRLKALLWTTAWSTQFEIGPISQASIGNVGLKGKQTWEDIVNTPTLGTAMLVGEDALDRFVIKNIERRTDNFYIKIFSRMIFNPTRNFSNLLRFKAPWYRDRPTAH